VADVLVMPALQLRHPVAFFVLVKANDLLIHTLCPGHCDDGWDQPPFSMTRETSSAMIRNCEAG
jgi:hypothetical protein